MEGLILKLKFQYFGHLMRRAGSLEKTLMLGNIEGKRRRGQQRVRWFESIPDSVYMNLSKLQVKDREAWHAAVHEGTKSRTQFRDSTATKTVREHCDFVGTGPKIGTFCVRKRGAGPCLSGSLHGRRGLEKSCK